MGFVYYRFTVSFDSVYCANIYFCYKNKDRLSAMEQKRSLSQQISYICFRAMRRIVKIVYPKISIEGLENLPDGACLLVGNHSQMHGPIIGELYIPGPHATWCAGEMMKLKEVPAYAYKGFWSLKPGYIRWFYKILSYIIAPISVCIFNNAETIAVYHDSRLVNTFRETVLALSEGHKVTIFPEHAKAHNHIINEFQPGFVDIVRMYRKKYGMDIPIVPVYIAPKLRKIYIGKALYSDSSADKAEERQRLCTELMNAVTEIAESLPNHTVVPYLNISRKNYPKNKIIEDPYKNEKASL